MYLISTFSIFSSTLSLLLTELIDLTSNKAIHATTFCLWIFIQS